MQVKSFVDFYFISLVPITKNYPPKFQAISAGSDGTIRLWSLGQQQCVHTFRIHSDSIWTLIANDSFTTMYSAGRDKTVWATDLSNVEYSAMVCQESSSVLKVSLGCYYVHRNEDINKFILSP